MKSQDWKLKYQDLKLKFHDAVDVAFRLGYEAGAQGAQLQQAQQNQAAQNAAMGAGPQNPNQQMEPNQPDGSELDQHINTLESMLQKSDPTSPEALSLKKSLDGIRSFKDSLKQASELKKSEKALADIAKAMGSKLNPAAEKNMSVPAKKALNMQEQIVEDLMKSFEEEEKKASESINKTLNLEQILKG